MLLTQRLSRFARKPARSKWLAIEGTLWHILTWRRTQQRVRRTADLELHLGAFPLANFITEISPHDAMFETSEHYVGVGLSALQIIDRAICQGFLRIGPSISVLDLPCGHGRVARILRSRFPNADLTVCDIDWTGVEFCASRFGARGILGTTNFDTLKLGKVFDLIWVGSLVTHFDIGSTIDFLRCMERHLATNGLLIITIHGKSVVEAIRNNGSSAYGHVNAASLLSQYDAHGYGYEDYPGNRGYGISVASQDWFEKYFANTDMELVCYLEKAWDNHQDAMFIRRRPLKN